MYPEKKDVNTSKVRWSLEVLQASCPTLHDAALSHLAEHMDIEQYLLKLILPREPLELSVIVKHLCSFLESFKTIETSLLNSLPFVLLDCTIAYAHHNFRTKQTH